MSPRKLLHQLRVDFKVVLRNGFAWVLLIILAAMIGIYHFIPSNIELGPEQRFLDESQGGVLRGAFIERGASPDAFVNDLQTLETAVAESGGSLGIVLRGSLEEPTFEVVYGGELSGRNLAVIDAALQSIARELDGSDPTEAVDVELLNARSAPLPMNARGVPMLITFEVILLGFLFIAVMVFQEKQDGVIRAYRVSPGGTAVWLASKLILFIVMSWLYGAVFVAATVGPAVDWLRLTVLFVLGSAFMTLVGLTVAVFYDNLSEWFVTGVFVLIVNMIPVVSWGFPSWTPTWVTWMPSFALLFMTHDVLFQSGNPTLQFTETALLIGVEVLLAGLICWFAVQRKLMRAGS